MKRFCAIFIVGCAAAICHAEPRWCSIIGKGPKDTVSYPPIAKAARIQGVVLSRIIYKPNGKVENIEPIFGPPMLAKFLAGQMMDWTVATDSKGEEMCETLVIAKFQLSNEPSCNPPPDLPTELDIGTSSILRLELRATPYLICDPAAEITSTANPLRIFVYRIKRGFHRLFGNTR